MYFFPRVLDSWNIVKNLDKGGAHLIVSYENYGYGDVSLHDLTKLGDPF